MRNDAIADALALPVPQQARRPTRRLEPLLLALHAVARSLRLLALAVVFLPRLALRRRDAPALLKRYLQASGGGFVKLGQTLAMRYDLLPEAYCDELLTLLDRMPAAPLSRIERIVEEDLGRPASACFGGLDPTPLGSASIAQVHAGVLVTGERVAVKVARPGIARTLRIDLAYLRLAARLARQFGILRRVDLGAIVAELCQLAWEELDFRREARNLAIFHQRLATDDIDHRAPRVHFDLCGPRVITMELIEGLPMTSLLAAVRHRDHASLERWAQRGIRPRRTARLLLWSILEQTMHHRVFNADPHPANLVVENGGTLAWLDFGMVGWLDEHTWTQQLRMQRAIAAEQVHTAVEALLDSLAPLPARDLSTFELQARGIVRDWINASRDPQATMAEKSTARFLVRLFEAIRSAGISVPADLLRMFRTMIVSDTIVLQLDPGIDWVPELREFAESQTGRRLRTALRPEVNLATIVAAGQAWLRFFTTSANLVNWLDVRIPEMTAAYQDKFSDLGRIAVLLLRYLRAGIVAFVVLVLLARIPQIRAGPLAALDERSGHFVLPILLAGMVAVVVLSRVLGEVRPR
ncbi:MAG TPA: AarF/UbiB family protein [Candidatus Dormibacteraeota bacterium]|nr:AarF/UbiB family protein [Candidatus Dormibacteraeota bacterium]